MLGSITITLNPALIEVTISGGAQIFGQTLLSMVLRRHYFDEIESTHE